MLLEKDFDEKLEYFVIAIGRRYSIRNFTRMTADHQSGI